MRVAALFDIHGNLPALEAVLEDVSRAGVDQLVIGGDVLPGPWPGETLDRLLGMDIPVHFIHGNGELGVLAQLAAMDGSPVTYWGTTSGKPLRDLDLANVQWTAQQVRGAYEPVLRSWPKTLNLRIGGLGQVLFCHGTPRSETEIFTRLTAAERLMPIFEGLGVSMVVCGHTHMQFDRMVGGTRVINAGSVGMSFGRPGAAWALLGPGAQLRQTHYDISAAAERIRATHYPGADPYAHGLLQPPSESEILEQYSKAEVK